MEMKTLTVLLICALHIFAQKVRYDDFRVYRVYPKTEENLKFLRNLDEKSSDFTFWTRPKWINESVDVMVSPSNLNKFETIVASHRMESNIFIGNVQKLIDNERANLKIDDNFGWTDYHTLEEINTWLSSLVEKYPGIVSLEKGGTSYEGREILGVRISFGPGNENRSVFIESNIHACEWIGSATSTYILNQLLISDDPRVRQVAESHDWYFFPVVNPDGFAYTHSTDRLWRKTRVPYKNNSCFGADPNRNWDFHFNEGGSSSNPCSGNYRGLEAFSEPSMKTLSDYISKIGPNLEAYFAFHSYSQVLLLPYGYTTAHLDNYDELYNVGLKAIENLTSHYGTKFTIGAIAEAMYIASGSSLDWVKGIFQTRITYAYELRDTGEFGMLLPADQIIPTGEETFDSLITIFEEFAKLSQ